MFCGCLHETIPLNLPQSNMNEFVQLNASLSSISVSHALNSHHYAYILASANIVGPDLSKISESIGKKESAVCE